MDLTKTFINHVVYPGMEMKNGNQIRAFTKELIATQGQSEAERRELVRERLRLLLLHCAKTVPAYAFLNEREIEEDPFRVLYEKVPVLDKNTFNENPQRYLSKAVSPGERIENLTGGSTGVPTHFYMTRDQVERYEAARWRGLSWHGIDFGSRSVMIWGSHIELDQAQQAAYARKEKYLKNREMIPAYALSADKAEEYIAYLNRYKPEYLYGYSSSLAAFAGIIKDCGKEKLRAKLKLVVATSDMLYEEDKALIEEVFGCPCASEYGARDAGILAYGCPCGHIHVSAENAILEILDPVTHESLPSGESGVVAVTDLASRAQPRLRWLLGDTAAYAKEQPVCACGITLPVLCELGGREDSMLVGADGRLIHGHMPNAIVREYKQVRRFRFVQHTPTSATLYLQADPDEALAAEIVEKFHRVEPGWQIETVFTDEIDEGPSGKKRASVREFPLG